MSMLVNKIIVVWVNAGPQTPVMTGIAGIFILLIFMVVVNLEFARIYEGFDLDRWIRMTYVIALPLLIVFSFVMTVRFLKILNLL